MSIETIFERVLEYCQVAPLPAPWLRAPEGVEAYLAPGPVREVLGWLELEFGAEAVIESGLAIVGPGDGLRPSERWPPPNSIIVPWRTSPADPPYDLLVESGSIQRDVLPVLEALRDHHTLRALNEPGNKLLLASTLVDVVVLRAAGMAVTTAHGLGDATQEQLGAIEVAWPTVEPLSPPPIPVESHFPPHDSDRDANDDERYANDDERYGNDDNQDSENADQDSENADRDGEDGDLNGQDVDRDGGDGGADGVPQPDRDDAAQQASQEAAASAQPSPPADIRIPPELTVVAWQVGQLSLAPPDNLPEVLTSCEGAWVATGAAMPWEFSLWRPTSEEIDWIRLLLRQGRVAELHYSLLASMVMSDEPMFQLDVVNQPPSFLAADAAYRDALASCVGRSTESHFAEVRRNLVAAHEREVVQPFIVRAQAARHPARRAMNVTAANVTRSILQLDLVVDEALAGDNNELRDQRLLSVERLLSQKTRYVDTLIRIHRELTR